MLLASKKRMMINIYNKESLRKFMINYLSYDSFCAKIEENIQEYFNDEYYVRLNNVRKNNGINLTGLTVGKKSNNISPTIYLEGFYERYKKGEVYAQIVNDLINIIEKHQTKHRIAMDFFMDFNMVKGNIFFKLVNSKMNEEMLRDIPHREFLDMSLVYYYLVEDRDIIEEIESDDMIASILINNSHLVTWGVKEEDIYNEAIINTPNKFAGTIKNIKDVMIEIMLKRVMREKDNDCYYDENNIANEVNLMLGLDNVTNESINMYVLSNNINRFGASAILYNDLLKEFAMNHKSNLYVLPSSIHEGATCFIA